MLNVAYKPSVLSVVMLNVTYKPSMLGVITLNVIMLSVVAPGIIGKTKIRYLSLQVKVH